jgi:hypothetical protein
VGAFPLNLFFVDPWSGIHSGEEAAQGEYKADLMFIQAGS